MSGEGSEQLFDVGRHEVCLCDQIFVLQLLDEQDMRNRFRGTLERVVSSLDITIALHLMTLSIPI